MLGLGGGTVLVPVLYLVFLWQGVSPELRMPLALATSLGAVLFTALSSTWQHQRHGTVQWQVLSVLVPGILLGGLLGGQVVDVLPGIVLRRLFGCYLVLVALHMLWRRLPAGGQGRVSPLAGVVIGALATIMGVAGGVMVVPWLLWCGLELRRAISTAAAVGIPVAAAGTAGLVLSGWGHPELPPGSLGYVHLYTVLYLLPGCFIGAAFGAWLAHRTPVPWLRRGFAVTMALIGLWMLY